MRSIREIIEKSRQLDADKGKPDYREQLTAFLAASNHYFQQVCGGDSTQQLQEYTLHERYNHLSSHLLLEAQAHGFNELNLVQADVDRLLAQYHEINPSNGNPLTFCMVRRKNVFTVASEALTAIVENPIRVAELGQWQLDCQAYRQCLCEKEPNKQNELNALADCQAAITELLENEFILPEALRNLQSDYFQQRAAIQNMNRVRALSQLIQGFLAEVNEARTDNVGVGYWDHDLLDDLSQRVIPLIDQHVQNVLETPSWFSLLGQHIQFLENTLASKRHDFYLHRNEVRQQVQQEANLSSASSMAASCA